MKAIMDGKSVLFVSVPNLIIDLKVGLSLHQFNTYMSKFEKYDVVVLDELGYISFDKIRGAGHERGENGTPGTCMIVDSYSFEQPGNHYVVIWL